MKKLSGEGDALSRAIEGMQTAQAQQNQLMTQQKHQKKSKDRDTELF